MTIASGFPAKILASDVESRYLAGTPRVREPRSRFWRRNLSAPAELDLQPAPASRELEHRIQCHHMGWWKRRTAIALMETSRSMPAKRLP